MGVTSLIQSLADRLNAGANVKAVYGDPIVAEGKTIIPVARVSYGFGAGGGTRPKNLSGDNDGAPQAEGGGAGGGLSAKPIGVIEVTPTATRYVSFGRKRQLATALGLGFYIGWRLAGRRRDNGDKK